MKRNLRRALGWIILIGLMVGVLAALIGPLMAVAAVFSALVILGLIGLAFELITS
jgi:hypothetical protein